MSTLSRRRFIHATGITLAGLSSTELSFASTTSNTAIKAIAFDGFPIFDPRPVFKKVSELFPENGKQLTDIWRAKQFSYQWLRATGNRYKDFWNVTKDALIYAAAECKITISQTDVATIMNEYKTIKSWPDVKPALQQLKELGIKSSFLTNMTGEMVTWGLQNADIKEYFEHVISTDSIKTYKPNPAAYKLGIDTLKLRKEEILFVAFAGWDMAGAKWFGYPTYWVNRSASPAEELDAVPDGTGANLTDLVEFVKNYNQQK